MGEAYQCDVCGSYSSHEPAARLEDYAGGYGEKPPIAKRDEYWLCSACHDRFEAFVSGET
jgi:hypothetical protein